MFEQRYAARGAEFLDDAAPGWFERVNHTTIDLCSWKHCILGQVFGGFETGCDMLGLTFTRTKKLGFWKRPFHNRMLLELYWAKEVQARQHASERLHMDLARAQVVRQVREAIERETIGRETYDHEVHGL